MRPNDFPRVGEIIAAYWPILLVTLMPSIASSLMIQIVSEDVVLIGFFFLIPFFIITWLVRVGLNLHVVERHVERVELKQLLTLGAAFWATIFRALLLLAAIAIAIMLPVALGLRLMNVEGFEIAQLVTSLVILKWNLFLEPVLYRDRGLVFDAWATVKAIKLRDHLGLVGLYLVGATFTLIPYATLSAAVSLPASLASMGVHLILGFWALRSVCLLGSESIPK